MKNNFFKTAILLLITSSTVHSQTSQLWGVADQGGQYNNGSIYRMDENGANGALEHSFQSDHRTSIHPKYNASGNLLYGITNNGGANDLGTIFTIDLFSNSYAEEFQFSNPSLGFAPLGEVVEHSNGHIYMTCSSGGNNNMGSIVSYNPTTQTLTKHFDFNTATGSFPMHGFSMGADGNFYAVTRTGGTGGDGVLFKFNPNTNTTTILHSFSGLGGQGVGEGNVIMVASGNLVGTTESGGANNDGTIYEFNLATNTFTPLGDFVSASTGRFPTCKILQLPNGEILGATVQGTNNFNGAIYKFSLVSNSFTATVNAGLNGIAAPAGGFDLVSGDEYVGYSTYTMYTFNVQTNAVNVSTNFPPSSVDFGAVPHGTPYYVAINNIIGYTKESDFSPYSGTVFACSLSGNSFAVTIEQLGSSVNGARPSSGLVEHTDGKFYGAVYEGGDYKLGGIISFDRATNAQTMAYSFNNNSGFSMKSTMLLASDGNLYGVTTERLANGQGSIVKYNPATGILTNVYDFYTTTGINPVGGLIQVNNDLYGVLSAGGSATGGTLYKFNIVNSSFSVVHNFNGTQGSFPQGKLVYDAVTNKLFGVCNSGGSANQGVLYEYNLTTTTFAVLNHFTTIGSGIYPKGNLIKDGNYLYGATASGGSFNYGTVFRYNISSTVLTPVHSFLTPNYSVNQLIKSQQGRVFGLGSGGLNWQGFVYELDVVNNAVDPTYDLVTSVASGPVDQLMEHIITCQSTSSNYSETSCNSIVSPSGNYTYTSSGIYNDTIYNTEGCDSIITLTITINSPNGSAVSETACNSFLWAVNNTTYTTSGQYTAMLTNVNGCDSIVTLDLTINQVNTTVSDNGISLTSNENGAQYQWVDCDNNNAAIVGETNQVFTPLANGNYAVEITQNGCTITSDCILFDYLSVDDLSNNLRVFPNPTNGLIGFSESVAFVEITNLRGQELAYYENSIEVDLGNLENGIYFIRTNKGTFKIELIK